MPSFVSSAATGAQRVPSHSGGTTAPVLEFVCLFTHDLKRKQKRWQDGRVKYHTFNKRIMVYDERGNFVGDMHWCRDWEFDEGEEVQLERGSVIVQVAECVGRQEQDLSELLDKRAKEKEQRAALRPSIPGNSYDASPVLRAAPRQDHFQTRHRPLHQVIGTPTGHHGRAVVPSESPFEQRHKVNDLPRDHIDAHPAKRRRHDVTPSSKMGYAQSLFGAPLTLSAVPMSSAPLRRPPSSARLKLNSETPPSSHENINETRSLATIRSASDGNHRNSVVVVGASKLHTDTSQAPSPVGWQLDDSSNSVVTSPPGQGSRPDISGKLGTSSHFDIARTKFGESRLAQTQSDIFSSVGKDPSLNHYGAQDPPGLEVSVTEMDTVLIDDNDVEDNVPGPARKAAAEKAHDQPNLRSKKGVAEAKKKQPTKRKKTPTRCMSPLAESTSNASLRPAAAEGTIDSPQKEQRTELRIKARQKRGLLVASEIPKKSKRLKRGKVITPELSGATSSLTILETDEDRRLLNGEPESYSCDDGNRSASSSVPNKRLTRRGGVSGSSPQFHDAHQEMGNHFASTSSASLRFGEVSTAQTRQSITNQSKPSHTTCNIHEDSERGQIDSSCVTTSKSIIHRESAPGQPLNSSRTAGRTKPDFLASDSASSDGDYFARSRNKLMEQKRSSRALKDRSANKRLAAPWCEDTEDDLPKVPAGPRLARLSRRGVRSKEIIGYVMSSSPVPEETKPQGLGQEPLSSGEVDAASDDPHPGSPVWREATPGINDLEAIAVMEMQVAGVASRNGTAPGRSASDDAFSSGEQNSLPEARREKPPADRQTTPLAADTRSGRTCQAPHLSVAITPDDSRAEDAFASPVPEVPPNPLRKGSQPLEVVPVTITKSDQQRARESNDMQLPSHKDSGTSEQPSTSSDASRNPGNGRQPAACAPTANAAPEGHVDAVKCDRPRIANPASRGRKAALKSDAAGQVPQSILPPVEPALARLNTRPISETRRDSNGHERPRRTMTFPGFMSARGGGPWSREAHDLLETGRPG